MGRDADPIRVLHVDDDPNFVTTAAALLERQDSRFDVTTTTDPTEGLELLDEIDPDCVVSDYEMPELNGIEFLETVQEDHPNLPFVLFTGKGNEEVASAAITAGVTDYLQKESDESVYAVLANRIANAVEQARSRRELAASQRRLSLFIDQSPLGVIEWNESFDLVRMNDAAETILGYDEDDLRGESWEAIVPESDRETVTAVVADLLKNEGGYHSVNENVRADGERIVCEWHNRVVTDGDDVVAVFSQFQDVTRRHRRERALRELQHGVDELVRASTKEEIADVAVTTARDTLGLPLSAVHLVDEDRAVLEPVAVTDEVRNHLGHPPTYNRRRPSRTVDEENWSIFERGETVVIDDTRENDAISASDTPSRSGIVHPLGDHGLFVTSSPEPNAFDDNDVALVEILGTTTTAALDRAERETMLREKTRRLEAETERLEQFAQVVSHDLRNPLDVAQGRLSLAREECTSDHLEAVTDAHERMRMLIDDILALAREDGAVDDLVSVDLGEIAEQCWQTVATAEATLVTETDRSVRADETRLRQLLENLVRNAIEHGDEEATVTVGDTDGGFYVADDGPGIPPEDREQVFQAGFSTSERGTGFGLSIVSAIADAHGWDVSVTAAEDGGARFEVTGVESPAD